MGVGPPLHDPPSHGKSIGAINFLRNTGTDPPREIIGHLRPSMKYFVDLILKKPVLICLVAEEALLLS